MQEAVEQAVEILKSGGLVGLPTETVYGLAAAIDQPAAIEKIFLVKERPFFDPLIVHVTGIEDARGVVAQWPEAAQVLAENFWPGPLTMVLKKQEHVNELITSGLDTVGVRCPAHELARKVIRRVGMPLAAPSANKFGKTSPTTAEHVRQEFSDNNIFVLDGGPCLVGVESTVLAVEDERILIYRPGMVTGEEISAVLASNGQRLKIEYVSSLASPGNLKEHYMPAKPLVLKTNGVVLTSGERSSIAARIGGQAERFVELQLPAEAPLAARVVYAELRRLADQEVDFILFMVREETRRAEYLAVWDRLKRAASVILED